jgi:hypothetical protein
MTKVCCGICIGDSHLADNFIPTISTTKAVCSYCGLGGAVVTEPINLRDYFEQLLVIYEEDDEGRPLIEWLRDDWGIFRHELLNEHTASALLAEILNDGQIVRKKFNPTESAIGDATKSWHDFKREIMHNNRFFPGQSLDVKRLRELLKLLEHRFPDDQKVWYRTRIQKDPASPYGLDQMGAPPKEIASHGRANPVGVPYLYLASDEVTAVSETRPHTGETVSIARFDLIDNQLLLDLRSPKGKASPFNLDDIAGIDVFSFRVDLGLLELLGEELTRPVLPESAALNYIPTQYICELIKNCGYDGVIYRSSIEDGINLALFDKDKAVIRSVDQKLVSKVKVTLG